jgi:hypothetical protein
LWLPLVVVAVWFQNRVLVALSFLIATFASGLLVGRFGAKASTFQVGLGGALGGAFGFALALLGGGLTPWPVALGAFSALVAFGGAFAGAGAYVVRALRRARSKAS